MKCTAIKSNGERCKGVPIHGSEWCPAHHPDYAAARRHHGHKGGKRGGRGRPASEVRSVKQDIKRILSAIENGEMESRVGAVMFQGFNTLLRSIEMEHTIHYNEEIAEQVEVLWEERKGKSNAA